jgi:hypothetical protein
MNVLKPKCEENAFGLPTLAERINETWEGYELPEERPHQIELGFRMAYENGSFYYKYLFGRILLSI